MATERAAHSIPVNDFQSDRESFDDWVRLFEEAVGLATNAAADRKEPLYKRWLPLKLDTRSRELLKSCNQTATWAALKKELKNFLVDPQEKYNWQTNRVTPSWDGKESFHVLANKIKRLVDLYEEAEDKKNLYFFRFRMALPTDYRRAIDLGCDETKRTIDEAKKMAFRFQMSQMDGNPPTDAGRLATDKNVSFAGAALSDDRLKSVEMAVQGVNVRLDTMDSKMDKPGVSRDNSGNQDRQEYYRQSSSRDSSYRSQDRDRRRDDSNDHHSSRSWRDDSRRREDSRRRDDSRDWRDKRDRCDSRDSRDSRGWRGDRNSDSRREGRDRGGSRDSGSRDRRDDRSSKSDADNHRLATLELEPMFEKFCSLVMENSKQDKPVN